MIPAPRWERVKELFDEVVELTADRRAEFLAGACAGDETLRREVESLVASHEDAEGFLATRAAPPQGEGNPGEPMVGQRLGPYRLVGLIGRGGMGDVYRAVRDDDHFKKVVAVKLVRAEVASEPTLARFRAERQILAGLEHPGIARLLDGGATETGRPFLVMEHVEGTRIDTYAEERALDTRARLELFGSVCAAVQYAHQSLVVHRDLKPANILVTAEGSPKLLDFGVAKLLDPAAPGDATATAYPAMTPAYASPEQFRGEAITTASDVYSLGVVLYELLTGASPYRFTSGSPLELQKAICEREPERPSAAARPRRPLADDLDAIVLKALRKSPPSRYPTVEALSADIQRYLTGLPVTARKGTVRYRMGKLVRRNRVAVGAAGLVLLLVLGFVVSMIVQGRRVAREKDKAQRVTAFLVDLFKVSDPRSGRGSTVTAREMLDEGKARIESELKDQPEVRASLLDSMGRVYGNLGLYDQAVPLLEDALETRKRVLGKEHVEVAQSLNALANLLYEKGDYARAETLLREALALREILGDDHPEVALSLNNLGSVRQRKGDFASAEALYRESLALRRRILGNDHPDVARSLNNLGVLLKRKGDDAGAEAFHREALALRRRLLGEEHLEVARSMNNLALVRHAQGDYAEAESLHREALARKRRLLGDTHVDVARSLNNLANVFYDKGDYMEAEALQRESLAISRQRLGKEHADVAIDLSNIANILVMKGDAAGGEAMQREALAMRRKLLGEDHPEVADSLDGLASALDDQGRHGEAEALYGEAVAIRERSQGREHSQLITSLTGRADALRGRPQSGEAEALYRRALELSRKIWPAGDPHTARPLVGLASLLIERGRWQEAEPLAREAADLRRKSLPPGHPDIAEAESILGECLTAARRFEEAEPLLRESHSLLAAKRGTRSRITREAAERTARLYEAWGKREKVAEYRAGR